MQTRTGTPLTDRPRPVRALPTRSHSIGLLAVVLALGYAADQLSKAWALRTLDPGRPRDLVGSVLRLRLVHNPGAAFSLGTNATWLLTLVAIAVVLVTLWSIRRLRSNAWAWALGLLLAGALGNLTDRFVRPPGAGRGEVVDFLQLPHWPIFNVADMCVVTAACLIALLALRGIGLDGTKATDDPKAEQ